jgi:hypothetical protein
VKLPARLKIGGRDYVVDFPHQFTDSCSVLYGLHDPAGQTIKISLFDEHGLERHNQSILQTFIHEVLHAIDNVYNGGVMTTWDKGEESIDQLAEGILQVIYDNPEIWEEKVR